MVYIGTLMGDRLSALLVPLMALQLVLVDRKNIPEHCSAIMHPYRTFDPQIFQQNTPVY